jgi:hypothetical protein
MLSTVRQLHRRLVRWVVRTFDLPARGHAWRTGTRAHAAAHHVRRHRPLPHHRPGRARVLQRWQAAIGRILS